MRLLLFIFGIFFIIACQRPYGHNEIVTQPLPDSLEFPQIAEIEDTEDPFQYYRLARLTYDQGNAVQALAYAEKAVQLDDENAFYYYLLAQVNASLGKSKEALDNALKSYSLGYVNPELQIIISQQYYAEKEYGKGERFLDAAIRKKQNDPSVTFLKAVLMLQKNDTTAGLQWIEKTLAIDSAYTDAIERKAKIAMAQKNIQEAISLREKIYTLEPKNTENLYTLGVLNLEITQYDAAEEWFRQLVQLDANNLSAYLQLSEIKLEKRQYDSVRFYAEKALQYDQSFDDVRLLIARSYDRQYRYNQALEVYQEILSRDSTFEIAIVEMEQLLKKIAYLRRVRQKQDSIKEETTPAKIESIKNPNNQDD
ncbi:MAG: tetratricopeptide repeat protein [Candidatus Cyclobacteriaceae bacterium M2_1C_046]